MDYDSLMLNHINSSAGQSFFMAAMLFFE